MMFDPKVFELHTMNFVRVAGSFGLKKLAEEYRKKSEKNEQSTLGRQFTSSDLYTYYNSQGCAFSPLTPQQLLNIFCDVVEMGNYKKFDMDKFLTLIQDKVDSKHLFAILKASEHKPTPSGMFNSVKKAFSDKIPLSFMQKRSSNINNNNNSDENDSNNDKERYSPFGRGSS